MFPIEKLTEKGHFAGTPAGCPRDTWPPRGFSEKLCDFPLCALLRPNIGIGEPSKFGNFRLCRKPVASQTNRAQAQFFGFPTCSGNRKRWRQTGSQQSTPLRKFSIDPGRHTDLQNPAEVSPKGKPIRKFSIDHISTIRTRLRTPLLRTPFPRLSHIKRGNRALVIAL